MIYELFEPAKDKEMKRIMFIVVVLLVGIGAAVAQVPSEKQGLLAGEGLGQGMLAEQNGFPGPKHVLDLSDKLELSDQQKKAVADIYVEMQSRAKELGAQIVNLEQELSKAFEDKLVVEKSVRDDAEQIGRLQGRLRAVHLNAHLKTRTVLTQKQIDLYFSLRTAEKKKK
jgi:Spy/CpxP family protein refolding chaperone